MRSLEIRLVTLALVAGAALLGAAVALGSTFAALGLFVALMACGLALLGHQRLGILALAGSFATAPMYRGIGGIGPATPTDLLLLLGLVLLLPLVFVGRLQLPAIFLPAVGTMVVLGLASSALRNPDPVNSFVYLAQWLLVTALLPAFVVMWSPRRRLVDGLLWCYLAGQLASILKAFAEGALADNRYDGFAHHPNDFGLAGGVCVAIVLYLFPHYRGTATRTLLVFLALLDGYSVVMSGSRGVTLAVAVVIVLAPIVERSGLWSVAVAFAGALGLALLPILTHIGGTGGSLSRLAGDSTAQTSDQERSGALSEGWQRFLHSPFLGSGIDAEIGRYHNLFLEVAVAFGLFGVAAYLAIYFVLARTLFSHHPLRRIAYLPWMFLVVGVTFPGIVDRTIAIPMGLALLAAVPPRAEAGVASEEGVSEVRAR